MALLPRHTLVIFQDPVDNAPKLLLLSLSQGWGAGAESVSSSPEGRSRPAPSVQCRGAALRTRRYDSTWYIPVTIHRVILDLMDGERRYGIQPPDVSDLSACVVQFNSAFYTMKECLNYILPYICQK